MCHEYWETARLQSSYREKAMAFAALLPGSAMYRRIESEVRIRTRNLQNVSVSRLDVIFRKGGRRLTRFFAQ